MHLIEDTQSIKEIVEMMGAMPRTEYTNSSFTLNPMPEQTDKPQLSYQDIHETRDNRDSRISREREYREKQKPGKVSGKGKGTIDVRRSQQMRLRSQKLVSKPIMYDFDIFIRAALEIQRVYRGFRTRKAAFRL